MLKRFVFASLLLVPSVVLAETAPYVDPTLPSAEAVATSRSLRIGRYFAEPVAGFAAGFVANVALINAFSQICGSGDFVNPLDPSALSDVADWDTGCIVGLFVVNFGGQLVAVPAGVTGIGKLMKGLGTFMAAFYGGIAAYLGPTLLSPQIGIGATMFIGGLIAPFLASLLYELSSRSLENQVTETAWAPIVTPILRDGRVTGVSAGIRLTTF